MKKPRANRPKTQGADWSTSLAKVAVIAVLAGGLGLIVSQWLGGFRAAGVRDAETIVEPRNLSALAVRGKPLFEAKCAECHGLRGAGTEQGPPFVNDIYNPGHHPDEAFLLAPRTGVRAHHWAFGDMLPVEGVTDDDLRAIIRYVREVQQANGIRFQRHTM